MSEEMNDQMQVRRQKLQELRDLGIDPFGQRYDRSASASELKQIGTNSQKKNYMKRRTKPCSYSWTHYD